MLHRIESILKKDYFKSLATLVSGSALAQLITIVVAPVTTRLFSPTELGVYTLVVSAVNMFGMVLSLRYDIAIVYEEDEHDVYALVLLSCLICLAMSFFVAVGYWLFFTFVSGIDYSAFYASVFIFFLCLSFGIVNVLNAYNNRLKEYRLMTKANVRRTVFQNGLVVLTGLAKMGETGLLLAQTIGYCAGLRSQSKSLMKSIAKIKRVSRSDVRAVGVKHRRQALFSAPASLANGFSYTVISYFIEYLYSAFTVGLYSISVRVLGLPMGIVSTNVSRLFMQEAASEKAKTGCFRGSYKKTFIMLCAISIPLGLVLIMFSPPLFGFIFGSEWYEAGIYVQILTPMFMLRFIAGGLSGATMISGKQSIDLLVQIALVLSVSVSFIFAMFLKLNIDILLLMINVTTSTIYVMYIAFFWRCSHAKR